jgi:hypothetical protein
LRDGRGHCGKDYWLPLLLQLSCKNASTYNWHVTTMKIAAAKKRATRISDGVDFWILLLLCVAAGLRVFVYCAAFPFFNNVDEVAHFDLVVKYSHGQPPRGFEPISPETAQYIAQYATPEYLARPERLGHVTEPRPSTRTHLFLDPELKQKVSMWQTVTNPESSQAPLYYALAGLWMDLGRTFIPAGKFLLYWVRFLNAPVAIALVLLAHFAARLIFPESRFMRLGVPALMAFFPQDAFYSIQNDVLSPICFGLALIGLMRLWHEDPLTWRTGVLTGLALAATGMVKVSNLPLLAIGFAILVLRCRQLVVAGKLRASVPAIAVLAVSACLPLAGLCLWNQTRFGDLTGSAGKIAMLGWTRKPFAYWWIHPIFSPAGFWTFSRELIASFWRGEIVWFSQRLASPAVDYFFVVSSVVTIVATVVCVAPRSAKVAEGQRLAIWLSLACCLGSMIFLALLSMAFDFGNCVYPSRDHPYFVSGRLMSGALVPFGLLFVMGLDRIFARFGNDRIKWLALAAVILIATVSQFVITRPVFSSHFNLPHA